MLSYSGEEGLRQLTKPCDLTEINNKGAHYDLELKKKKKIEKYFD